MSEALPGDPASAGPKAPLYKNPWFWGVLFCLIFPPCIRPFTRHIPEPPAVSSQVASLELERSGGGAFSREDLTSKVQVVAFVDGSTEGCPALVETLKPLTEKFDVQALAGRGFMARNAGFGDEIGVLVVVGFAEGAPVDLPGVETRCELASERWTLVGGGMGRVLDFAAQVQGVEPTGVTLLSHSRLAIVDQAAAVRGLYGSDRYGLDEVYNRSQHVLIEHRIALREAEDDL
ncbi:MAG: hypothetical protein VX498_01700 [Myxococcota bacterium]|nr:hypothetical protein [Myxococcota bacterium]